MLTLIGGLPDTSCYVASLRGKDDEDGWRKYRGWGQDRMMAADQWDLDAAVATAGTKHRRPVKYPRPVKRRKRATWRDVMAQIREAEVSPDG